MGLPLNGDEGGGHHFPPFLVEEELPLQAGARCRAVVAAIGGGFIER